MPKVQSQREPIIVLLRKLQRPKGREEEGRFVIESAQLIERALRWGASLECLLLEEAFATSDAGRELVATAGRMPVYTLSRGLMAKCITNIKPVPHAVAIAKTPTANLEQVLADHERPFLVAVDEGDSADNLGMLIRSADAAGAHGVILGGSTVDAFGWRVVRASRGAVFALPILRAPDLPATLRTVKEAGIQVVGTSANTDAMFTDLDFVRGTCVVVGNEHVGIGEQVLAEADTCVKMPMLGKVNSLNIAVAASVIMYEVQRQRLLG